MNAKTVDGMLEVIGGCMGDAPPYCHSACPMHTDPKIYVGQIADGKYDEALATIREKLFLPKTLGRVCAHPCEEACKREELGQPLSIAALKRFVADKCDNPADWDLSCEPDRKERIAVIGAGPAGAQAALDLRKKGYQVTVYDKLPVVGGMLYVGIPAYRLPRAVIDEEYSYLTKLGVDIQLGKEVGKDIPFDDLLADFDAVIVAIGAHKGFKIPLPGNDMPGVILAADFLREVSLTGKFSELGKKITVIGGGNVALDAARTAVRLHPEKVNIVCLERSKEEMFAHDWEVDEAIEEGIEVHNGWGTVNIEGAGKVERMNLKKCVQVIDPKGRFNPAYDDTQTKTLDTDTVIFAIGQSVDNNFASNLVFRKDKRFEVDERTLQTNIRKVFACGEATGFSAIAVEAMAEGRIAAESVHRFLNRLDMRRGRENERAYKTSLETTIPESDTNPQRLSTNKMEPEKRLQGFDEVDLGFTEAEAVDEASRCLKCECRLCVKECVMLQEYGVGCPKALFTEILRKGDVEPIIPFSCNTCGMCTLVCPKDYDIQGVFVEMRKEMVKKNKGKSPMKGHKAIDMHQFLGFSKFFNTSVGAKEPSTNPDGGKV